MAIQVKLLVITSFLLLFTLSFCEAKKATVKVVGILHSKDSIKNQPSNIDSSLGTDVFIICNNAKTQGNGGIDMHGEFNVTLSAEIGEDDGEIDGCYARLQGNSGAPCHIQEPQAASVKVLTNGESENGAVTTDNSNPTVIEFSPLDCQSAFFWPFPNLTFLGSPPSPPEFTAPPSPEDLPPTPSPSQQQPLPPPPQPSYDPPAPALPPSQIEAPSPAPPPTYQDPIRSSSPPPQPIYGNPLPSPPPSPKLPSPPLPTPPSVVTPPPQAPPPQPIYGNPSLSPPLPTPPSATVPGRRRPSPIPRAPRIPRLPLTPSVPRKYFNPPNSSKSKPPRLV